MTEQVDLEMKTAFLERAVEKLQVMVREQSNALLKAERRITLLEDRVQAANSGGQDVGPHNEKPPHY